ncbi:MAG: ABC transporter substrate-binding protein [Treponema sp.]|nr:ABC transporter substrate-binding protein [Treponema sp.]
MLRAYGRIGFCAGAAACLCAVLLLSGCSARAPRTVPPVPASVLFTDSVGRDVAVPAEITRIVPSGTLAQMFLLAIAPDLLCAVSSAYTPEQAEFIPPAVLNLPVVGQFYGGGNLNLEEIAALGPDVVIDIGDPKDSAAEDMDAISEAIAVPAVHITATLTSAAGTFRALGRLLGREERGEALALFCDRTLAGAGDLAAKLGNRRKSVLYCMGTAGLNVLAAGSFHSEVLDYLTDNRAVVDAPSSRGSGNEVNLEQLFLWDPEVILFAPGSVYETAGADPVWRQLRAIRDGAYYEAPLGPYNWMGTPPSINRYLGILWLETILYPEYAAFDLYAETAEYYRLFYGYDLSRERFDSLTANSLVHGPARGPPDNPARGRRAD